MKNLSFLISFLLFSIFINSLFCSAAEAPDPVHDVTGKNLKARTKYYILPVGRGGGLALASAGHKTCPLGVVQEKYKVDGLPLTFTPVNPKKGVIREFTDLNIKFSATTTCRQSTVWKLDDYDYSTGQYFITTGGVEGYPGSDTVSNWFKIEKYNNNYKLVYCPTVTENVICRDVGIYFQGGYRRLALSDVPLMVKFKKALAYVCPDNGLELSSQCPHHIM